MLVFLNNDVISKLGDQGESIKRDLLAAPSFAAAVLEEKPEPLLQVAEPTSLREMHPVEV